MNWYYAKNGAQQGPLPTEELKTRIAMGEVSPTDLAWREGMADWLPVGQIAELKNQPTPAEVPDFAPSSPVSAASPSPYSSPSVAPASAASNGQAIPNYLWQSIVVTIFCCWPFGIPAIVNAAKVEGLKGRGDFAGAKAASDSAKKWCIISLALGLVFIVAYGILIATGVMTEIQNIPSTPSVPPAP
jgi:hypothetical protein